MKKLIYMLGAALCLFTTMTARAQKYKVPADTVKLNKEYLQVTTEIASLTEKLVIRSSFGIINAGRNSA